MRPIRLELSGFTAFRTTTVVDFEGCDYFALCGPTGAGKSSIIDAMAFALYGAIPRLDRNQVAPIISQGLLEAKVRLDFAVDGQAYTAVRIVSRAKTGATTKEARLERGGEVLAGDAKSLTEQVERILGLGFDHFTKCVVLPQGEFMRFLHDRPSDRQDLLVKLLDLELYGRMAQRSREMATEAEREALWLARRLEEELSYATQESLTTAKEQLGALEALWSRVEEALPRIESLKADAAAARAEAEAAEERSKRVSGVAMPAGVGELAEAIANARAARTSVAEACEVAGVARTTADETLTALPARATLELAREAHAARAAVEAQLVDARATLDPAVQAEAQASKGIDAAGERVKEAQDALDATKLEHRALELARTLVPGEPCPVCRQVVSDAPALHAPADVAAATKVLAQAVKQQEDAQKVLRAAERNRVQAETRAGELTRRLDETVARLADHPDATALDALLLRVETAEQEALRARNAESASRKQLDAAQKHLDAAESRERDARRAFDATRDAISDLGPPAAGREDLAADWQALASWALERAPAEQKAAAEASARAEGVDKERKAIGTALVEECQKIGLDPQPRVSDATLKALAGQRSLIERIEAALEEIEQVQRQRAAAEERRAVAAKLGQHLSAKGFEKWILDEALGELVDGASSTLMELSSGTYSLSVDEKSSAFMVIDHRSADEQRPAKTLSGGETFLASLALALALSDRLAQMAAQGARLDAIFLDEGFGTLDPETLDVVASAVETLAASGRMVGLVTHVREIAERVPVRFEVRKGPDTSTVEKVLA